MLRYFLKLQFKKSQRFFVTKPVAKMITIVLFLLFLAAVVVGVYKFFYAGFSFIAGQAFFEDAISLFMYELFLVVVMAMAWISSVIAILFSLFRNKSNGWLLATPGYRVVPYVSFIQTTFSVIWVLLIIMAPALVAAVQITNQSVVSTLFPLVLSVVFAAGLVALVFVLTISVGRLLALIHRRLLSFGSVLLIHVGIMAYLLFAIAQRFRASDLVKVLYAEDLGVKKAPLTLVSDLFHIFPTHPLAQVFLYAQTGQAVKLTMAILVILGAVIIIMVLFWLTARLWFLRIWQALSENSNEFFTPQRKKLKSLFMLRSPLRVVIFKELISFTRNGRSLFWFLFISVLWLLHIGSELYMKRIITAHELQSTVLPVVVSVLPVAVLAYFTAALVLRFAFPSFSEERDTAWVFLVSPLKQSTMIWAKFVFYTVLFSVVTLIAETLALGVAVAPQNFAVPILILSLVSTLFLTAVGVALGAAFPNFETSDPEKLSTSLPGLATVFVSVAYGAAASYILYIFVTSGQSKILWLFEITSVIMGLWCVFMATKRARRLEFVTKVSA